jgi:Histidine kinase
MAKPPKDPQKDLLSRRQYLVDLSIVPLLDELRDDLPNHVAAVARSDGRPRIVAAGNVERRRIERDLHDGAQQRLVSIGLTLRHAQHELGSASPERAGRALDGAVAEVAVAIDELRELARGLPPSQLDGGWRRPSTSSPAGCPYLSRWTRRASVSAATSRRRPTSSAARA